jgi:two-component system, chemotaxis family, chemotaxis protein CheV
MANVLDGVDQRTQLAGHNRLELLLFRLASRQRYAINVFKVREVLECPPVRSLPTAHPAVRGVAHIRGHSIPVVDLGKMLGRPLPATGPRPFLVITEFNRSVQGFLVGSVDRIVNLNWEAVLPPPSQMAVSAYLTAVTKVDDELVGVIDVEKVFAEVAGLVTKVSKSVAHIGEMKRATLPVLVVDDSSTARLMVRRCLEQLGITVELANDGREALDLLKGWADEGRPVTERVALVISDIEMPRMDGYTLTAEIRRDARLSGLYVLLHSSLSGVFNDAMARKVGADHFIAKFDADNLARHVLEVMERPQSTAA